jgi:hypothetical protein
MHLAVYMQDLQQYCIAAKVGLFSKCFPFSHHLKAIVFSNTSAAYIL